MEFSDNKPIYLQIVDYAFGMIMSGAWLKGELVPSVRELAGELGVNGRTVLKAMEYLQAKGVIHARRGMGFILADDAIAIVTAERSREFFSYTLPAVAAEMKALGIDTQSVVECLKTLGVR